MHPSPAQEPHGGHCPFRPVCSAGLEQRVWREAGVEAFLLTWQGQEDQAAPWAGTAAQDVGNRGPPPFIPTHLPAPPAEVAQRGHCCSPASSARPRSPVPGTDPGCRTLQIKNLPLHHAPRLCTSSQLGWRGRWGTSSIAGQNQASRCFLRLTSCDPPSGTFPLPASLTYVRMAGL